MSRERWSDQELSAYLDGHLEQATQVALEADLARDPVLRHQVAELRQTVALLRALPLREPPRNLLLTPAMVAPPRPQHRPFLLPFMRLTTALAGLAFVLTVGLQLLPSAGMMPAAAPALQSTQAAMEAPAAMVAEEKAPSEETVRSLAETGTPVTGALTGQADTPVPAPATTEDYFAAVSTTPEPEPQLEGGGVGGGGGERFLPPGVGGRDEEGALTLSPVPEQALVTPLPYPTPTLTSQKALLPTPTPQANQAAYPLAPTAPPQPSTGIGLVHEEREPMVRRNLLPGWLAPTLGTITLALGAATWWLARHQ